jgi:hypothetical protein
VLAYDPLTATRSELDARAARTAQQAPTPRQ